MSANLIRIDNGKAHMADTEELFPWSASRLKKLLICPRQFRFAYIDHLPILVTAPLAFGRAVHEAIQRAHTQQMTGGSLPPVHALLAEFDALWHKALEEDVLFRPSHPAPERYVTMGHEMLRVFHAQNHEANPPLVVELPFEVEVPGERESFRLRGVIDRVDEMLLPSGHSALIVVDYKSGSRKIKVEEAQGDLQLTIYALAIGQMLDLPVERVEFHWLRDGLVLASKRDETAFAHLTREVLPYASKTLASGQFKPCPGYWCRWCDFREPCQKEGLGSEKRMSGGESAGYPVEVISGTDNKVSLKNQP